MQFKVLSSFLLILALIANQAHAQQLKGMGSTLSYPRLIKMIDVYQKQRGVQVDYVAIGAKAGIDEVKAGKSDFTAIDTPLDKKDSFTFPFQQVPVADENFGIIYNLPGLKQPLRLSRSTFEAIMHGQITRWNDERLQKINPNAILPNEPIILIKRDSPNSVDWSVSRYLNQSDKSWKITKDPQWKIGIRGRGFGGIDNLMKDTKGGIAFVVITHGQQLNFPFAEVEADGKFHSIYSPNYPIWTRHFLIWKTQSPRAKQTAQFARWILIDGLKYDKDTTFRPLPSEVRKKALTALTGK